MHHTRSGQTQRSPLKEEREWKDITKEKKSYLKRKQEFEEAHRLYTAYMHEEAKDDDPPF